MKTIIDSRFSNALNLSEIFRFKDLLWNLAKRDILVRYKQTFIGVLWALIRPLINIVIFGFLSQFIEQTGNVSERFLQVAAGVIIWSLISTSINDISNSVVANANILTKVYFPKLIIPVSAVAVCLIDFGISLLIVLVMKFVLFGFTGWSILLMPLFVLYAMVIALSAGIFFSALNVRYRDVKFIIPFLLQIGFYVCPVFLSSGFYTSRLPESLSFVYLANPLVTVIEGFKYSLLGTEFTVTSLPMMVGLGITLLSLILSVRYFVKFEKAFADYI